MNILIMTNTFTPHVGGVARSIEAFISEYRKRGHKLLIIAPEFENQPKDEIDVIRIPSIENFNGSDFSVALPIPGFIKNEVKNFNPDIIHSHHPFLLGATALRIAYKHKIPIIFTYHTMYENYTHYAPGGNSDIYKRFIIDMATSYANLCDLVFAPSQSIYDKLKKRKVNVPIEVIPTGVRVDLFKKGSGNGFRKAMDIPEEAFLIGHIGRLSKEKNLEFLVQTAIKYMKQNLKAHFFIAGKGPLLEFIIDSFKKEGLSERFHKAGILEHPLLSSAYKTMDIFLFTSKSETQGMVLTEAMAAGTPVIALDASGSRDVINNRENGILISNENTQDFVDGLDWFFSLDKTQKENIIEKAKLTAFEYSLSNSVDKALINYQKLIDKDIAYQGKDYNFWNTIRRSFDIELKVFQKFAGATMAAFNIKSVNEED